jgi:hypothetical protein
MVDLKGKILGTAGSGVGAGTGVVLGTAVRSAGKGINQSINVLTNNIDVGQVMKYGAYFCIIFFVCIALISGTRELLIGIEQAACATNPGELIDNLWEEDDAANCARSRMSNFKNATLWEIEWYFRALLFISMCVVIGGAIYSWAKWLMDKLLRAEFYIKKIEDWSYGFTCEGTDEAGETTEMRF